MNGVVMFTLLIIFGILVKIYREGKRKDKKISELEHCVKEKKEEVEKLRELERIAKDAETYIKENQILRSENQMAARIQNSMIPKRGVLDSRENFEVYGDIDFAREVGGDYYDYFPLDKEHVCLSVGDVSGKGVPAVIYMVASKLLLKNSLLRGMGLEKTYHEVNRELFQLAEEKQFVTSFTGILDIQTGEMAYVNAGHTPPLLLDKNGGIKRLTGKSGLPLGSYYSAKHPELMNYQVCHIQLREGDTLFVYTDGYSEAMNHEEKMIGLDGLEELLRDSRNQMSLEDQVRYIQRQIITFENHEEQDDDCTVMGVRWKNLAG